MTKLLKITTNERMGFIDTSGKVVIPPRFDGVNWFSDGLAAFTDSNLHGYIDEKGNVVIPAQFRETSQFQNNVAFVQQGGLYGLIDRRGSWICAPKFKTAHEFSEGLGLVQESWTSPFGYIGPDGKYEIQPKFHPLAGNFSDGLAKISESSDKYVSFGYINKRGEVAIPLDYAQAYDFSEGLAAVSLRHSGRVGFINKANKLMIDYQFDGFGPKFSEGFCPVRKGGRYGFIDKTGRLVVDYKFNLVEPFSEGLAAATLKSPRSKFQTGYIDPSGEWVIEPKFLSGEPFKNGIAHITPDGLHWGYINKKGEYIWEPTA